MKHAPKGPVKAETHGTADPSKPKCKAHKTNGEPCGKYPIKGGTVCPTHGGSAPQVKFAAAERLKALQPKACQVLENLLDRDEYPTVQMAAVRDVLDRTEGKAIETQKLEHQGKIELTITKPW